MTSRSLQRYNRLAQAKHRGSKNSYKTLLENCQILLAWESAELTEGQASKALGVGRIEARTMLCNAKNAGVDLAAEYLSNKSPKK